MPDPDPDGKDTNRILFSPHLLFKAIAVPIPANRLKNHEFPVKKAAKDPVAAVFPAETARFCRPPPACALPHHTVQELPGGKKQGAANLRRHILCHAHAFCVPPKCVTARTFVPRARHRSRCPISARSHPDRGIGPGRLCLCFRPSFSQKGFQPAAIWAMTVITGRVAIMRILLRAMSWEASFASQP